MRVLPQSRREKKSLLLKMPSTKAKTVEQKVKEKSEKSKQAADKKTLIIDGMPMVPNPTKRLKLKRAIR